MANHQVEANDQALDPTAMSISQVKQELDERHVRHDDCLEKVELFARLILARRCAFEQNPTLVAGRDAPQDPARPSTFWGFARSAAKPVTIIIGTDNIATESIGVTTD